MVYTLSVKQSIQNEKKKCLNNFIFLLHFLYDVLYNIKVGFEEFSFKYAH